MNCDEFSREFDILWNNATSNQAPSINSYEKSVYLTQALEAIVLELYKGGRVKPNNLTEEISSYLSPLIKDEVVSYFEELDSSKAELLASGYNVVRVNFYDDCWFVLYESALVSYEDKDDCCSSEYGLSSEVIPTAYDRFERHKRNPFKKPNDHRVFRLNINGNARDFYLVFPKNGVLDSYHCTYLRRPNPIVLEDLTEAYGDYYDLSVNGVKTKTECELHDTLHREILVRAVDLAKTTWVSTIINNKE